MDNEILELLNKIVGTMATKDDLTSMATKDDLKASEVRTQLYIENTINDKLNALYEGLLGAREKLGRIGTIENNVEEHDHRIFALEQKRKA